MYPYSGKLPGYKGLLGAAVYSEWYKQLLMSGVPEMFYDGREKLGGGLGLNLCLESNPVQEHNDDRHSQHGTTNVNTTHRVDLERKKTIIISSVISLLGRVYDYLPKRARLYASRVRPLPLLSYSYLPNINYVLNDRLKHILQTLNLVMVPEVIRYDL